MDRKYEITSAKGGAAFTVRVVTRSESVSLAGVQEDGSLRYYESFKLMKF